MRGTWKAAGVAAPLIGHGLASVTVLGAITGRGPDAVGGIRLAGEARDAVAVTFDDGPSPATTPRVLALLEQLGLRATFFVLGRAARAHRGLVTEIVARGHEVGTHGMEHRHHLLRSPRWIAADLARSLEVIGDAGATPQLFRPPYGQAATASVLAARRLGLRTVLWSAWGREWTDREPASVAARVFRHLRPGGIVLLHDSDELCGPGSVATVEAALPLVAAGIEQRGWRTAALSELCR